MTDSRYPWYEDEAQELDKRGVIRLVDGVLDKHGRVCLAQDKVNPKNRFVLKAVEKASQEALNILTLHSLPSRCNHIIPTEILECEHSILVIMPYLTVFSLAWGILDRKKLFSCFAQILEGLEFMHEHHIAFVDIAPENFVFSEETSSLRAWKITEYTLFFIDFGSSRQMPLGPKGGSAIRDYLKQGGHFHPPEGTDKLDPYAYDIYSLGQTIYTTCHSAADEPFSGVRIGPSLEAFVDLLADPVPTRRPSAKQAKRLWSMLSNWLSVLDHIKVEDVRQRDALDIVGWRILKSKAALCI